MTQEKRKHGGYRPGAGRKAVENKRVQVTATVERDTRDTIKDYCKAKQTRLGRLLDTMVERGIFDIKDKITINGETYVEGTDTRFSGCEFCDVRKNDFEYFNKNCLVAGIRPCGNARYLKKD